MSQQPPSDIDLDDCPGRFKCHGPAGFCDQCGDVDLICDDPACVVHKRGDELLRECREKQTAFLEATEEYKAAKKARDEAEHAYHRWSNGNPVMVGRLK